MAENLLSPSMAFSDLRWTSLRYCDMAENVKPGYGGGTCTEIVRATQPRVPSVHTHMAHAAHATSLRVRESRNATPPLDASARAQDLLEANGAIFTVQGRALNDHASGDLRVLVVGNSANTNCLIAMNSAPDVPEERFTAMMRLDHNRAMTQVAQKAGVPVTDVSRMTIWGNHSATQYPDLFHCQVGGRSAVDVIDDRKWLESDFIPTVQRRGAAIIEARGASSAASAANAAIGHVHDWVLGTGEGDWVSMGVASDGSYGVPEGLLCGFPTTCSDGQWSVVQGLELDEFSRGRVEASVAELESEREMVQSLGLI